jgi:hypothetical protein
MDGEGRGTPAGGAAVQDAGDNEVSTGWSSDASALQQESKRDGGGERGAGAGVIGSLKDEDDEHSSGWSSSAASENGAEAGDGSAEEGKGEPLSNDWSSSD